MGKLALLMMLCSIQASAAVHTLKCLYTGVTGGTALPEFSAVGLVDDEQFMYYDSKIIKAIPKTEWIEHAEDKNYWDTETRRLRGEQQSFKAMIANVMKAFEQTQGLHTLQQMFGCEWDYQTGLTDGFWKYGYDGEDFLIFDMKIMLWKAPVPQASSFAERWNNNQVQIESEKLRLTQECTDWLKKYVSYGRRVLPEVSLFQKDSSSPVVCHTTGFFPCGIMVTWQRDREEVQEGVELGETLPNGDGTFQITSRLRVKPEDLENYTYSCTVQHKSLKKYIIMLVTEKELNKIHSLKYFYTAVTASNTFPKLSAVGLVDDEQFMYYDSKIIKAIPKTEWIEHAEDKNNWDTETRRLRGEQQSFKAMIANVMKAFEQTQGLHTLQQMFGCEWDYQTGLTDGFWKYGYDGEDFLIFDMKIMQWNASVLQASSFALKWNNNQTQIESEKIRLTQECTDWLKKYVSYGRSTLERRVRPEVSLLQKDSSSPVICHATGFFPRGINVTWQRDGEEVQEGVELGEMLPNGDGTFQITSRLRVKPEEWKSHTYTCTVQHKSLEQDIVMTCSPLPMGTIGCVVGALIVALAVIGVIVWRKRRSTGYGKAATDDSVAKTAAENGDIPLNNMQRGAAGELQEEDHTQALTNLQQKPELSPNGQGGAAGELQEEDHTQASTNLQQKPELSPNRQRGAAGELQEEDRTHCLKCL